MWEAEAGAAATEMVRGALENPGVWGSFGSDIQTIGSLALAPSFLGDLEDALLDRELKPFISQGTQVGR